MNRIAKLAGAAALAMIFGSPATAQEIELSLAHVDVAEWQVSKKGAATQLFKNIVEIESGGRIQVNLFPAGQLGGESDLVQSVQSGSIEMAMTSTGLSQLCPEAAVYDLPYLFPSEPVAWRVVDGEFGKALDAHCLAKTGIRNLGYGDGGFRNFTTSTKAITSPADIAGMKLRVMTSPVYVKMVEGLGGEPTPIPWPDTPAALATGVVDGQENPVGVIIMGKLYESQKFLTLDQHTISIDFILINEGIYQSLSGEDKALLRRAALAAGNMGRSIAYFQNAQGLSYLAEQGVEITKPTPEQMEEFRNAAQPPVAEWLRTQMEPEWLDRALAAVAEAEESIVLPD